MVHIHEEQLFRVCVFPSLLVTREKPLDLLDDGQVAGVLLRLAHLTPVPDKLLDGGLELVHVKDGGRTQFLQVLLGGQREGDGTSQNVYNRLTVKKREISDLCGRLSVDTTLAEQRSKMSCVLCIHMLSTGVQRGSPKPD